LEGGERRTEKGRGRTEKVLGVVFPDLIEEKTLKDGGRKREDGEDEQKRSLHCIIARSLLLVFGCSFGCSFPSSVLSLPSSRTFPLIQLPKKF
jgi:hypothetical protein